MCNHGKLSLTFTQCSVESREEFQAKRSSLCKKYESLQSQIRIFKSTLIIKGIYDSLIPCFSAIDCISSLMLYKPSISTCNKHYYTASMYFPQPNTDLPYLHNRSEELVVQHSWTSPSSSAWLYRTLEFWIHHENK
jgi:hypothetical protein